MVLITAVNVEFMARLKMEGSWVWFGGGYGESETDGTNITMALGDRERYQGIQNISSYNE